MEVIYKGWTGPLNIVREPLIRSIGQYTRHYSKVKVGITSDPERRSRDHQRSTQRWNTMVVKYKTSSVNFINQLEKIIIDHHWDYIENEIGGGGGPNAKHGPYYLYVLLK